MRLLVTVLLALMLSGCPFGGVSQMNRIPHSAPLSEPELFNRPGILRHDPTGFTFSERYDNFQRVNSYRYDQDGIQVSIGYNDRRPGCLIVATIYIYPAPRMTFIGASPKAVASLQQRWLRDEFASSKADVESAHPNLQERPSQPSTACDSESVVQGPSFHFAESDLLSEMHLLIYDRQWFVKCRFTYPKTCEAEARARLDTLTRQFPWATTRSTTSG